MKIKTATCHEHRDHYGWSQDHAAHAYRLLFFGARRCPKNTWMHDLMQWDIDHPSLEERTYRETKRIRELLEQQVAAVADVDRV